MIMKKTLPSGFISAIPQSNKDTIKTKMNVSVIEKSWGDVLPQSKKISLEDKDINSWNKRDFAKYFWKSYFKRYGSILSTNIPYGMFYLEFSKALHSIETQLSFINNKITKSYFDWFFNNISDSVVLKNKSLRLSEMSKVKNILLFKSWLEKNKDPKENIKETIITKVIENNSYDMEDLAEAFSINSQYFVQTYGIVLVANYLYNEKKQDLSYIRNYITNAIEKSCKSSKKCLEEIIEVTKSFEPYMKNLYVKDFSFCTEEKFNFSKESEIGVNVKNG